MSVHFNRNFILFFFSSLGVGELPVITSHFRIVSANDRLIFQLHAMNHIDKEMLGIIAVMSTANVTYLSL